MNKKILSLVIALVLVLGSVTTVFAGNFDLIHKLDSRKNTAMLELMEDLDVYDQVFEDFANYELEYESKKYALVDIQEKLDAGADGLQEAIEQIDKGEEPSGGLEVVEVSAINNTQIEIKFNQKVTAKSATDLGNYYLALTADKVTGSSIKELNTEAVFDADGVVTTAGYKATLQKDGKTVLITAHNTDAAPGAVTIWTDVNSPSGATALSMDGTNDVTKNKTTFIQARNLVLEATGKKADTVQDSFIAKDTVRPEFAANEFEAEPGDTTFVVEFTEPVFDNGDVKYYFDGEAVTATVYTNDAKTLTVTLPSGSKLEEGNFKFDVVGLQDYSGNHTMPNQLTTTIKVLEEDVKVEAPQLLTLNQVHDGAFELVFDKAVDSGKVTIKNLIGDNTDAVITINSAATKVTDKTSENYGKFVTVVDFAALTGGNTVNTPFVPVKYDSVYKNGATKVYRTVIVEDYKVGTSEKGKKVTRNEMFVLDNLAPVVAKAAAADDLSDIVVTFVDAPFYGNILEGSATDKIIVKYVEDGITYTYDNITADFTNVAANKVALGLKKADQPKLFNAEDKLKNGEYTVILPAKLVKDDAATDTTPQFLGENEFIGATITFKVTSSTNDDVPQTATNLVSFDDDKKAIEVKFVGKDIDPATAKNVNNYTFAGKALPSGTVIEYTEDATHGIAYIYLPENSVERNGNYTMVIKNVATKSGARMLETTVLVNDVKDNTQPVLESAVVTANNTVELTFDESIDIAKLADADKNIRVVIGTAEYTVDSVTNKTTKTLVIETVDTFDTNQTVKVKLAKDASGGMYIYDVAGNKAAEKVVTATVNLD